MNSIINIKLNDISVYPNIDTSISTTSPIKEREIVMTTSFIHPSFNTRHEGAERAVVGAERIGSAVSQGLELLTSWRNVSAVLLSAIVSALLFASDKLMEDWANEHTVWAWVTLWCVAFVALSIFNQPVRRLVKWFRFEAGSSFAKTYTEWQARRAAHAADEAMWAYAQQDPRLMAEIQARLGGR
jgi:hypothetical protein